MKKPCQSVSYPLDNDNTQAARIFSLTTSTLGFNLAAVSQEIKQAAAVLGRKGGKVKSKAKTRAARVNGKKGGRPRKVA